MHVKTSIARGGGGGRGKQRCQHVYQTSNTLCPPNFCNDCGKAVIILIIFVGSEISNFKVHSIVAVVATCTTCIGCSILNHYIHMLIYKNTFI